MIFMGISNRKSAFFQLQIGRFLVCIVGDRGYKPTRTIKGTEFYSGEGELFIFDEQMSMPTMEKDDTETEVEDKFVQAINVTTGETETLNLKGAKKFSVNLRLAHSVCFGSEYSVPPIPENIIKAISWCQLNQNFMKSHEGI